MGNIFKKLAAVQSEVKATKDAYNAFGKYHYRSCESILEAVKPILAKYDSAIIIRDDIKREGDRYYIMATAMFADCETNDFVEVTAYAREEDSKKGMDGAQVTGAASSYARKYALAGLLLLDDNKDPDAGNKHGNDDAPEEPKPAQPKQEKPKAPLKPVTTERVAQLMRLMDRLRDHGAGVMEQVRKEFNTDDLMKLTPVQFNKVLYNVNAMLKADHAA